MKIHKVISWFVILVMSQSNLVFADSNPKPIHTIVLIRHAERTEADDLSPQGRARAIYFANMFKDELINKIYSTNYLRTQLTVTPLARDKNIAITLYESNESLLHALANDLKSSEPQKIVIVGHSNTLAEIIYQLGGPSLADLGEFEFDNLYIINKSSPRVGFQHLHYGIHGAFEAQPMH